MATIEEVKVFDVEDGAVKVNITQADIADTLFDTRNGKLYRMKEEVNK